MITFIQIQLICIVIWRLHTQLQRFSPDMILLGIHPSHGKNRGSQSGAGSQQSYNTKEKNRKQCNS